MRLSRLLAGLAEVPAGDDRVVSGVVADSRRVRPGDLFLACAGRRRHGAEFIARAVAAGAAAVVCEVDEGADGARRLSLREGVPVIAVSAPPDAGGGIAAEIAARFHGRPADALEVVGVTGTNGKSSCCHYLAQCLEASGSACGLVGTLGHGRHGALHPATHTTPDAVTLQALLAELRDEGCTHVAMEVSSHALDQGRVTGVRFAGGLFTNLSRDHLDYHGSMTHYARSKARLFRSSGLRYAALNADDPAHRTMLAALPASTELGTELALYGFGPDLAATVRGRGIGRDARWLQGHVLAAGPAGLHLAVAGSWGAGELRSALLGRFNAGNLLASLAVLLLMGLPLADALAGLARVRAVPGRMERFGGHGGRPLVIVDYAHTPAALAAVLESLKAFCRGRLWCVFGCGGGRDRGKRGQMGGIAERLADRVVVTDDNPRDEDPEAIVAEILAGMRRPAAAEVLHDRAAAIAYAVGQADAQDIVLVAGKGHEDYQLVQGRRLPFSDRQHVALLVGEAAT